MEVDSKGILLFQVANGLPFYSQVICSSHVPAEGSSDSLPQGRTLFLRSLDPVLNAENLQRGLSRFGNVEVRPLENASSSDSSRPEGSTKFHAVFESPKNLSKIVSNNDHVVIIPYKSHKSRSNAFLSSVLHRRRGKYRGMDILQKNADECLVAYDIAQDVERRLEKETIIDEDGFVLVTQGPSAAKAVVQRDNQKRARKGKVTTVDFYRFPNKEKIMSSLAAINTD
ncbi:ribosomal protein RNA-processing 7 homolog A, putative [Babesia ovis]|uniref:Ribosomal protein RNA-processing 7 homolog A, putative n=1 Tax=Babesia ovis TaxID=5869 RepID=A0A9W5TB48_BABOV|nr:ribosomal protein RNA-processing 7 homolog A, putative [Babesia ovis]